MTISNHPALAFESDRAGSWGNMHVKSVEWDTPVLAVDEVVRLMKIYPGMRILKIEFAVSNATVANADIDVGWVKGNLDPTVAGFAAADGDIDYFITAGAIASVADYSDSMNDTGHRPLDVKEVGYITIQSNDAIVAANVGRVGFLVFFEYVGND